MRSLLARSRKDEILQAATRVFLSSGFFAANIDEVAREAGVSKPTIYKHFESKEELFHDVVMAQSRRFTARLGTLHLQDLPPKQGLEQFAYTYLAELLKPTVISLYRIAMTEALRFPMVAEVFFREACLPIRGVLIEFLRLQDKKGKMTVPDAEQAAENFYGMLQKSLLYPILQGTATAPTEELIQKVVTEATRVMLLGYPAKAKDSSDRQTA